MPTIDDMISQEEIDALLGHNYITSNSDIQKFKKRNDIKKSSGMIGHIDHSRTNPIKIKRNIITKELIDSKMSAKSGGIIETQTGTTSESAPTAAGSPKSKVNEILLDGVDPKAAALGTAIENAEQEAASKEAKADMRKKLEATSIFNQPGIKEGQTLKEQTPQSAGEPKTVAADDIPEPTIQMTQEKTKLDSARELRNNAHERLRTLYEKKNAVINGNNKAIYEARRKFSMQELKSIGATRMSDRIAATSGHLKDRFINGIKNIGVHAHNALQYVSADDPEFKDLKKTRSVRERIIERQNSRLADAAFGKKINKAINARNDADNLYKRIKNHDQKYSEMEINEKTARKARQETIAARRTAASSRNLSKLGWKGKAGAAAALLALGGVIGNQFSGGHKSNAQLYNPNPQPQYTN